MIPASLVPYKAWLMVGAALALATGGFAAGWTAQGWRKGAEVSTVQASHAEERAQGAQAIASSAQQARAKESNAGATQTKATDDLSQAVQSNAGRAADLERRLRDTARTHPDRACMPQGASASSPSDEPPAARLPDVARSDLVRLAQSANDTADTLRQCRVLLHSAWKMTQ